MATAEDVTAFVHTTVRLLEAFHAARSNRHGKPGHSAQIGAMGIVTL
jgi:hypothetical protein